MKKLLKAYLPYAAVIALIYLGMPAFFQGEKYVYDAVEYQFVFPSTALLLGVAFSWKRGVDFTFPLLAPIFCVLSAILWQHWYHWWLYSFVYLVVGMLGCFIGDMVYKNNLEQKRRQEREQRLQGDTYKITITNITVEKEDAEKDD